MKKLCVVLILVCCMLFSAGSSTAAPVALGDPMIIGSWAQRFEETGVGPYNKMEAFIVSGTSDFEFPFTNFSVSDWTSQLVNPGYVLAAGAGITYSQFDISFTGNQSDPLAFVFLAWLDNQVLERAYAAWTGSAWDIRLMTPEPGDYNRTAVPEPASMLLLGLGLVGLGISVRKRS